jgi:hypothetical protein
MRLDRRNDEAVIWLIWSILEPFALTSEKRRKGSKWVWKGSPESPDHQSSVTQNGQFFSVVPYLFSTVVLYQ